MTHYYLYIKSGVQLDADTRFYRVAIGESAAQRRIYAWLESYAIEHGHFFVKWSIDAVIFLEKCSESIGHDASPLAHILGTALVRSLKNGCDDPATFLANQHRHELLMRIDPRYFMYHELSRKH